MCLPNSAGDSGARCGDASSGAARSKLGFAFAAGCVGAHGWPGMNSGVSVVRKLNAGTISSYNLRFVFADA